MTFCIYVVREILLLSGKSQGILKNDICGNLANGNFLHVEPNIVCCISSDRDCTDALKTSLASALRHSRHEAERTYDRRMSNQRKEQALSVTRGFAEESLSEKQPAMSSQAREFEIGEFVGLVEEGSALNKPLILIGQIQSFLEDGKVSLLWYTSRKNLYSLNLDGNQWVEDMACLTAVTMNPARNQPGRFRLATSLRAIHKTLMDQ